MYEISDGQEMNEWMNEWMNEQGFIESKHMYRGAYYHIE